ncbi:MAG: SAM-dependent methyltransferase [Gammaproteobacteria bacterium]
MAFQLSNVVPWGRSFDEYVRMFSLTDDDLQSRILGCGDGPASFNAILSGQKGHVVSCDPIYRFSAQEIRSRIAATATAVGRELAENADEFVWTHFDSTDAVIEARMSAMEQFLLDFPSGKRAGRYVDASLPQLPFPDDAFDLALCSHFLFLYSQQHDFNFHVNSIRELSRVASDVRIFPLLELGSAPSRHLQAVIHALEDFGLRSETVLVPYEFQKGGNRMLVVKRSAKSLSQRRNDISDV